LDGLAQAAGDGQFRLSIAEVVPLKDAIPLVIALEKGRKLNGNGPRYQAVSGRLPNFGIGW